MILQAEFKSIVGERNVSDDAVLLESFARDHSFAPPRKPAVVVRPRSSDEIRRIVLLSRKRKYRLVPVSSGAPRFRGDTVPQVDDAVIVDLSGMNSITWINRENRVALVEPGVTFGQLQGALEKQGLRTMMPLLPRASKSVVGACMEREPFTTPKYSWDLGDPVASTELILGDGYVMRTGGGAGPAPTLEAQRKIGGAQKLPLSPFSMDVRRIAQGCQGSLAVCAWMSVRCELLPEHEKIYFAMHEDLSLLVTLSQRLLYLRLTDEQYILSNLELACLLETEPARIEALCGTLPQWILVAGIGGYGTSADAQFAYKDADLQDEARAMGIELQTAVGDIKESDYRQRILRKTTADPWKLRLKGDVRELFFLTTAPRIPLFIAKAREMISAAGFDPNAMGVYLQPVIQGTACHCQIDLFCGTGDAAGLEPLYNELSRAMNDMGGYFSRPYGVWADIVYPHCETFVKYARGLKRIFDPDLVMNPEKVCFKEMAHES